MKKFNNPTLLLFSISMLVFSIGCASRSAVKAEARAAEEPLVLTDMRLQDNGIVIAGNKQFVYTMYKGNDPYKMTIDIPDMGAGIFRERIVSDKAGITEVVPQQVDFPIKAMKITIALQSPSTVTPVYKDNTLTLTVKPEEPVPPVESGDKGATVPAETVPAEEPAAAVAKEVPAYVPPSEPVRATEPGKTSQEQPAESVIAYIPRATEVTAVEVNRAPDGAKVTILGNGSMMPNVFPIDERIVIDIPGVALNAAIPTNTVSPLRGIRAGRHKDKVRLVLDLREKTKFEVTAVGKSIEVALKGKTVMAAEAPVIREKPARESVREAQNQTLHQANQARNDNRREPAQVILAQEAKEPLREISNKTLPADNGAMPEQRYFGKKISLDFQDAEIGPIFRLLADVNGYNLVLDPGIKGKATIKLMNVPWDRALKVVLELQTPPLTYRIDDNVLWIAPESKFISISEDKKKSLESAEKLEDLVQEIIRVNYATSSDLSAAFTTGKLLSPRGTITQDTRMNTLIIKDTQKSIDKMKALVRIMDVTKPQVMIEARIVQVSKTDSEALGIRWGGAMQVQSGTYPVAGSFSVNSPVTATSTGGTVGMTIGAANSLKVDLSLSALESIQKAKTLSSPKIITLDNEPANIQQGSTFFVQSIDNQGQAKTEEKKAILSLDVTPKITPDGYIQVKVVASDDSIESGTGSNTVVNTKKLTTNALIKNGETLVLGGIYTSSEIDIETGVPLLNKIPGLGWLFKSREKTGPNVRELLIFITPTIVTQQAENKL
jgi:type IV pilus assembly protein PilQ